MCSWAATELRGLDMVVPFLCLDDLDLTSVSYNALQAISHGQGLFSNEHKASFHWGLLEIESPNVERLERLQRKPLTNPLLLSTLLAFL